MSAPGVKIKWVKVAVAQPLNSPSVNSQPVANHSGFLKTEPRYEIPYRACCQRKLVFLLFLYSAVMFTVKLSNVQSTIDLSRDD